MSERGKGPAPQGYGKPAMSLTPDTTALREAAKALVNAADVYVRDYEERHPGEPLGDYVPLSHWQHIDALRAALAAARRDPVPVASADIEAKVDEIVERYGGALDALAEPVASADAAWCEACGYAHDARYNDCAALLALSEHEYLLLTNAYYRAGWDRASAAIRGEGATLDVDVLARALVKVGWYLRDKQGRYFEPETPDEDAADLAAEYARLASRSSETDRKEE